MTRQNRTRKDKNHCKRVREILSDHYVGTGLDLSAIIITLGNMIGLFKQSCTLKIRKFYPEFEWQSRFYDRVIRNDVELDKIRKYIVENPLNWTDDDYYVN